MRYTVVSVVRMRDMFDDELHVEILTFTLAVGYIPCRRTNL